MRKQRTAETSEQRQLRLVREAEAKRAAIEAEDAAVARMIRQNIAKHGP
jgi:hypothetical protein